VRLLKEALPSCLGLMDQVAASGEVLVITKIEAPAAPTAKG
jgi:hypothetical protein